MESDALETRLKGLLKSLSADKSRVLELSILQRADFLSNQEEFVLDDIRNLSPQHICRIIKAVNNTVVSCNSKIDRIFEKKQK